MYAHPLLVVWYRGSSYWRWVDKLMVCWFVGLAKFDWKDLVDQS